MRLSGIFSKPKYDNVHGTGSTDDLNEGFGKKFAMTYATEDDKPLLDGKGVNLASCWLEVSISGIKITNSSEKLLAEFELEKIPKYKVSEANVPPTFTFSYSTSKGMLTYTIHTPQNLAVYQAVQEAIQMALAN